MNTIEELQHAHSLNKDLTNHEVSHQTSRDRNNMSASGSAITNVTENDQREGGVVTSHGNVAPCLSAEEHTTMRHTVADKSQDARGRDAEGASKEGKTQGWTVTLTDSSGRSSEVVSVSQCRSTTL